MDNAELHLRLGVCRLDGFGKSLQTVHTGDQDVFHATVLKLGQNGEPELGSLGFGSPHAEHILDPFHSDGYCQVDCLVQDLSVVLDLDPDGVQIDDGIDFIQRAVESLSK